MPDTVPASEVIARLREVPFLSHLSDADLEEIRREGIVRALSRDEALFARGEPARGLLVVLRGSVRVYQIGDTGREHVLTVEGPGSSVAELPLFDGGAYPAHAAAAQDAVLFVLPKERFQALVRRRPDLAGGVIRTLAGRLRKLVEMVEAFALKEVRQRVAGLLLMLAEQHGPEFTLPANNEQIAARLGTVREVVSRALHGFAQDGLIQLNGRSVRILDPEGLRDRS